jgi:hypothetical protein
MTEFPTIKIWSLCMNWKSRTTMLIIVIYNGEFFYKETSGLWYSAPEKGGQNESVKSLWECHLLESKVWAIMQVADLKSLSCSRNQCSFPPYNLYSNSTQLSL